MKIHILLTSLFLAFNVGLFAQEEDLRIKADNGDITACKELAHSLEETNTQEAIKYYRLAAESGDIDATYALGELYLTGKGIEKNVEQGFKLISKAAEAGLTVAMEEQAFCYIEGIGTQKDPDTGIKILQKLAENGLRDAVYDLYIYFLHNRWLDPQYKKECGHWLMEAAKHVFPDAQTQLAAYVRTGLAGFTDLDGAFKLYTKAAQKNYVPAQYNLATMYAEGEGVVRNYKLAYHWALIAAKRGSTPAKDLLDDLEGKMAPEQVHQIQSEVMQLLNGDNDAGTTSSSTSDVKE